jgi:hypothetical protein
MRGMRTQTVRCVHPTGWGFYTYLLEEVACFHGYGGWMLRQDTLRIELSCKYLWLKELRMVSCLAPVDLRKVPGGFGAPGSVGVRFTNNPIVQQGEEID